jgi:photosystem II stability/assembly factor-like uncharacterized protein
LNSIIVGDNGTTLYSFNAAVSFQRGYSGTTATLRSVKFLDQSIAIAVGDSGIILRTTDCGIFWQRIPSGTNNILTAVVFPAPKHGTIIGANRTILHTSDAGLTWQKQTAGQLYDLNDVYFFDRYHGYILGGQGVIYKTYDGGDHWIQVTAGYSTYNCSFAFSGKDTGYISALNWSILKTANADLTFASEQFNVLENSLHLSQNYPNPFNPTTTISFQIPKNGFVSLIVYDALGREVQTLVNEEKAHGKYSIEFNASSLPSGVYFYTLRAGEFTATRKFVLMK